MCKYDIYESGYQNGIVFGYIPELDKEQMRIWLVGYKDAKDKKHKSFNEIDNI